MLGALVGLTIITLVVCSPYFLKKGGWKLFVVWLFMCLLPAYAIVFKYTSFNIFLFSIFYSYLIVYQAVARFSTVASIKKESPLYFCLLPAILVTNLLTLILGYILIYFKAGKVGAFVAKSMEILFKTGPQPDHIKWGSFHFKVDYELHYIKEVVIDGYRILKPGQINILKYDGANYFSPDFYNIHGFLLVVGGFAFILFIFWGLRILFNNKR